MVLALQLDDPILLGCPAVRGAGQYCRVDRLYPVLGRALAEVVLLHDFFFGLAGVVPRVVNLLFERAGKCLGVSHATSPFLAPFNTNLYVLVQPIKIVLSHAQPFVESGLMAPNVSSMMPISVLPDSLPQSV